MLSKREDIRRLLGQTIDRKQLVKMVEGMMANMLESFEEMDFPKAFWDELRTELLQFDEVENDLVEIYDRRLSHETVLWALAAYETPEGKAYFDAMVDVARESMESGAARGERITRSVMARHGLLPD